MKPLHPAERPIQARLAAALKRGTSGHYLDAAQYDHEYARRKADIAFYLAVARAHAGKGPILELGCGSGRLTVPLARAGHDVVGVDASAPMLGACRARAERLGLGQRVRLRQADFRELAGSASPLGRTKFPLVICPFNAFQHLYEREDIEAFLAGVCAHLEAEGLFVFDLMNPDLRWLSRDPERRWDRTRYKDPRTGAPMSYATQLVYDAPLQIAFMTVYHQRSDGRGRAQERHLTHRHFFPRELEMLLHYNGLSIERRDGDFSGGALRGDSEQQVLWCRSRQPGPSAQARPRPKTPRREKVDF